jgi:hypothetical protein
MESALVLAGSRDKRGEFAMHVFHVRGFSGVLMLALAVISAVLLLLLLPASFMMVLWNALVFESFQGPEIDLFQGFLLWGFIVVLLKLIFKPQIKFEFQTIANNDKKDKPLAKTTTPEKAPETKTPASVVEEPADQQ